MIFIETLWQDMKYGARQLWCNPGFTAVAALTLALGIGANTSIFSLLNALLLRPLAVPESSRVFGIYRGDNRPCSWPDFLDFEHNATSFSGLAADVNNESALDIGDTSQVILVEAVSWNYAAVLKINAFPGRWFAAEDERSSDQFPAVISYQTWQTRLAGDPRVIGRQVRLESQWYTVIGVAPKDFPGMALPVMTEVWVPLLRYARHNQFASHIVNDRQEGSVMMFGRLNPGVTLSQAQAQLNTIDVRLRRAYPRPQARMTAPLRMENVRGSSDPGYRRPIAQLLVLLLAVVVLVLLIACANVANLLLARGVTRRREVSTRIALGAGRARICRQMLVESLLLSLLGAAAGLAVARVTNPMLERALSSAPSPIAIGARLSLDGRVLGFVLIASVLTTVLFGLIPALQSSGPDLVLGLTGGEVLSRNRRLTLRNLSVVAQVTLSLMLLIVAGLFLRALRGAGHIDPGFDTRRLLSARLYVAGPEVDEATSKALYRRVVERARGLPGVRNATLSYASPTITMAECVVPDADVSVQSINAGSNDIGPNYFSTLDVPIIRGRDFTSADNSSAPPVAIVNQAFAHRYWPGRDAVGNRIRFGRGCDKGSGTRAEIVGVVKDALYSSFNQSARPYVFFPLEQRFERYLSLLVQTERNPAPWAEVLRKELTRADSRLRVYEIDPLSTQIDKSLWQTRQEASLLGAFGMLALLIASVGLYGVTAFAARRRTREFGIRMALGAQRNDVLRLVTGDALAIALAGVGLGLLASLAFTNLLRGFLYGLSPTDAVTFTAAAILWMAVSLIASCIPAWRATRLDPSIALRYE